MSNTNLSRGTIAEIMSIPYAGITHVPSNGFNVVQIMCIEAVESSISNKFRLSVSDGIHSAIMIIIGAENGRRFRNGEINRFTIIQLDRVYISTSGPNQIIEFKMLVPGEEVGEKLGNPVNYTPENARIAKYPVFKLDPRSVLEKMYSCQFTKDLLIKLDNGLEVKCHKSIVVATSPIMASMIEIINHAYKIEIKELNKKGVEVLVRHLYAMDNSVDKKNLDCATTIQLLKLAHKYEIDDLKDELLQLILGVGFHSDWFTADCLLDMYLFSMQVDSLKSIEIYSLKLLCCIIDDMKKCNRYKRLSREEMEQCLFALLESCKSQGSSLCVRDRVPETSFHAKETLKISQATRILKSIYQAEDDQKDCMLVINDRIKKMCHKSIIAAQSRKLGSIVADIASEAGSQKGCEITLKHITSEDMMSIILPYLYGYELRLDAITPDMAVGFLRFGNEYNVVGIEDGFKLLLYNEEPEWFSANSLVELFLFTKDRARFATLYEQCVKYMLRIPLQIRSCWRYRSLGKEDSVKLPWTLIDNIHKY